MFRSAQTFVWDYCNDAQVQFAKKRKDFVIWFDRVCYSFFISAITLISNSFASTRHPLYGQSFRRTHTHASKSILILNSISIPHNSSSWLLQLRQCLRVICTRIGLITLLSVIISLLLWLGHFYSDTVSVRHEALSLARVYHSFGWYG